MAYCLKITKKGGARYAQIVETFYDPIAKRSTSRAVESFGDLNKQLVCDPEFENKLRQRIVMLNHDDSVLNITKLDKQPRNKDASPYGLKKPQMEYGLHPLNYGLALERALWEELDLRLALNRLANNSLRPFPYDLDLMTFFLTELKINIPGLPNRALDYRYNTILNFADISAEQMIATVSFLGKRKSVILRHIRNQFIRFDQAAQESLLEEQAAEQAANGDSAPDAAAATTSKGSKGKAKAKAKGKHAAADAAADAAATAAADAATATAAGETGATAVPSELEHQQTEALLEHAELKRSQDRHCLQALTGIKQQDLEHQLMSEIAHAQVSGQGSAQDSAQGLSIAQLDPDDGSKELSPDLAQAVAHAVKKLQSPQQDKSLANSVALENVSIKSIQPFLGDTGVYDVRSLYIQCHQQQNLRQQLILGVLMTTEGIPLDYDYLFFGKSNSFRPQANLKQMVDSINEFVELFNWQRIIIKVDHTYSLPQLLLALIDLRCEYVLSQSAEFLPASIQHQVLTSDTWRLLKRLPPEQGTTAAAMSDPFEDWDNDTLVNLDVLAQAQKKGYIATQYAGKPVNFPLHSDLTTATCEVQIVPAASQTKDAPAASLHESLPEAPPSADGGEHGHDDHHVLSPKDRLKQAQSEAPDFKYLQFKLSVQNHELTPVAVALWSQKRTNAERHMWSLAQAIASQPQKFNIAGFEDPQALADRSDAFLSLLGNYNAAPPTDFELLKRLDQSYLRGEPLDEAEQQLLEQLQTNFLSGTLFFVTSKNIEPPDAVSLASLLGDAERYLLLFYRKLLAPWRWSALQAVSDQPDKLPPSEIGHFQGQVMVSFLAWLIEQWRSFRLYNLEVQCTAQALQRSLDLMTMVRWTHSNANHWLKINVERLVEPELTWDELRQIFGHFHMAIPGVSESDESLKHKLKLKVRIIGN